MEIQRPKSDDEYLDQRLKTTLEENVDKVAKVFILMKHYFLFTLIRDKIQTIYKDFKSDNTLTIDIESYKTCAQQREDSLNCGIFVIHYA
ncbi:hypothetical protein ACFX13_044644 [Malus domestica]